MQKWHNYPRYDDDDDEEEEEEEEEEESMNTMRYLYESVHADEISHVTQYESVHADEISHVTQY